MTSHPSLKDSLREASQTPAHRPDISSGEQSLPVTSDPSNVPCSLLNRQVQLLKQVAPAILVTGKEGKAGNWGLKSEFSLSPM